MSKKNHKKNNRKNNPKNYNSEVILQTVFKLLVITRKDLDLAQSKLKGMIDEFIAIKKELEEVKEKFNKVVASIYIDYLTNCYNQNYFIKYKQENLDNNLEDNSVAYVIVDINNLKETNDEYGHRAGDKLIIDCANNLKDVFYDDDIVIRIGGDEFMVICINYEKIIDFEDDLKKSITERVINKSIVNLAIGLAVFDSTLDSCVDDTIARADILMYINKERNRDNNISRIVN